MKVSARLMASGRLSTGKVYLQGEGAKALEALRVARAPKAWSSSCYSYTISIPLCSVYEVG